MIAINSAQHAAIAKDARRHVESLLLPLRGALGLQSDTTVPAVKAEVALVAATNYEQQVFRSRLRSVGQPVALAAAAYVVTRALLDVIFKRNACPTWQPCYERAMFSGAVARVSCTFVANTKILKLLPRFQQEVQEIVGDTLSGLSVLCAAYSGIVAGIYREAEWSRMAQEKMLRYDSFVTRLGCLSEEELAAVGERFRHKS
eukprot:14164-Heterococcus_DN1.PRE.2